MADYKPRFGATAAAPGVAIDEGLRKYMLRVYNYMGTGLAITGVGGFLHRKLPHTPQCDLWISAALVGLPCATRNGVLLERGGCIR